VPILLRYCHLSHRSVVLARIVYVTCVIWRQMGQRRSVGRPSVVSHPVSRYAPLCHVVSHCVALFRVVLRRVKSGHVGSRGVLLRAPTWWNAVSRDVT
jgi:hypothetical protein